MTRETYIMAVRRVTFCYCYGVVGCGIKIILEDRRNNDKAVE
jgi:hypothetical protein